MNNKKVLKPKYKYQRPILTEMLPFEVPPSFSNGGFFHFLTKYNVRIDQRGTELRVIWECDSDDADAAISIIFGISPTRIGAPITETIKRDGVDVYLRRWKFTDTWTRPFQFKINHKENDYRELSVIHPRNQLLVADFYDRNSAQVLYHCGRSNFSIRRPDSVVSSTKYSDRLDLSPKSPPALRGVLGVKSLALGRHLVHCLSLQKFHRGEVAQ
ncbi:hypothetical protein, partial [Pacificibacter marinus]